jgi:hypothetical protein
MTNERRNAKLRASILILAVCVGSATTHADVKLFWECVSLDRLALKYDSTIESELVRAFALDIVAESGTILDVNDFVVGPDNGGYGIFPSSFSQYISVDPQTGEVEDWNAPGYSPVADGNDPGALPGLGTYGVTVEMGSLYDTNAPGTTGTLFSIRCECVDLAVRVNSMRGGVVLENGEQAAVDAPISVPLGICDHLRSFPPSYPAYHDWVAFGRPLCWLDEYQCDGDADGQAQGIGDKKVRVGTKDLAVLIANWGFKGIEPGYNPCADIDHKAQGMGIHRIRVHTFDLAVLIKNWKKKDSELPGDCPRPE